MTSGERLDWPLLVLELEGGHDTEYRQPLEDAKAKTGFSPAASRKKHGPADILISAT